MTLNVFKIFDILFSKKPHPDQSLSKCGVYQWKARFTHQAELRNAMHKHWAEQEPFSRSGHSSSIWSKTVVASSLSCSVLAALLPALPCECFLNSGRGEGGKWSPASLSKVHLLGSCFADSLSLFSASGKTSFFFFTIGLGAGDLLTKCFGKLIFKKKITWLGVSGGAEQAWSWDMLGKAFALEPAAASVSDCTVVKEEREDARDM